MHLNYFIAKLDSTDVYVPFMTIMCFKCQLLELKMVEPELYVIVHITTFSFPITKHLVDNKGIERIINILSSQRVNILLHAYWRFTLKEDNN